MIVSQLNILVSKELYIKDPTSSDLGKSILFKGLNLLFELGLEEFTFKKLGKEIGTTESTIYRYFESKNQFLFYLFNYYWSWMEYQLNLSVANIEDGKIQLKNAIKLISKTNANDPATPFIDESILQQMLMVESSKTFFTKKVDEENKLGYFKQYKQFVKKMSDIVVEINPTYPYSHALVTTIIESLFHQRFFAQHLPSLSDDVSKDENLEDFFFQMAIQTILNYNKNGKF